MTPCRVVKVGGSLLVWPALVRQLEAWLASQPPLPSLLVAGGGELADAVRQLDRRRGLSPPTAHWMAIRAMEVNALVLSQLLSSAPTVVDVHGWGRDTPPDDRSCRVLLAERFLRQDEPHAGGTRLPCGWHVTSDSIAARLAEVCGAQELCLLKSTLPEEPRLPTSLRELAQEGLVDQHLPAAVRSLHTVRVVNLRGAGFPEVVVSR